MELISKIEVVITVEDICYFIRQWGKDNKEHKTLDNISPKKIESYVISSVEGTGRLKNITIIFKR